jgi:peptidoglycan pentaglycine glycine transferase (the first glycine)
MSEPPEGPAWDAALRGAASPAPLLQSWGFGETQAREGWAVERVRLPGGAQATVLFQGRGRLRRAYVPRGPVPATPEALRELACWAMERRLSRLRVEPEAGPELSEALSDLGHRPAPSLHPAQTLVVPLAGEDDMMASFKPKHRYNIRLGLKRGVTVEEGEDAEEVARQSDATARRQGISLPQTAIYRRRLQLLEWCRTYVARYQGRAIAAILVARFDGRAYYLFGGSSGESRELMPAYVLQWTAMRAAAAAGCRDYDLWGVPPEPDPTHPWHGLWQFKTGFGGELVRFCGAWDLVSSPLAVGLAETPTRLARSVRRAMAWGNRAFPHETPSR